MELALSALQTVVALAGPFVLVGVALAFITLALDTSEPKPPKGEQGPEQTGLMRLGRLAGLGMPPLLGMHLCMVFWKSLESGVQAPDAMAPLAVIVVGFVALIILPQFVGMLVAAISPELGHTLHRIAPYLALPALAYVAYFTWENAIAFLVLLVDARTR